MLFNWISCLNFNSVYPYIPSWYSHALPLMKSFDMPTSIAKLWIEACNLIITFYIILVHKHARVYIYTIQGYRARYTVNNLKCYDFGAKLLNIDLKSFVLSLYRKTIYNCLIWSLSTKRVRLKHQSTAL